ncbi:MAG: hypothetical protein AAFR38_09965 [Planctomycetota bacterium]
MRTLAAIAMAASVGTASAQVTVIDFSTEDDGLTPLVNGQVIDTEFGFIFNLSSSGANAGLGIFDTDTTGPNASGADPDLLVDLGNALILQNNNGGFGSQTAGVFDTANDDADGGTITFDFTLEVELVSLDLIDMNGNNGGTVTLTDANGLTRIYTVPNEWTFDPSVQPFGWDTLDLTTLADQAGETGNLATALEDAGFDAARVVRLDVFFVGSGALDNLTIRGEDIPAPGGAVALGLGGLIATRRRR